MEMQKTGVIVSYVLAYVQKKWFTLSLILLTLIAIYKRDWSFSIKLNDPQKEAKNYVEKTTNKITDGGNVASASSENTPLSIDWFSELGTTKKTAEMPTLDDAAKIAYFKRFGQVAINEQKKFGIPASIILALGFRQSYSGTRAVTQRANNHFALPCSADFNGAKIQIDGACVRQYESAWLSYRDNSLFLTQGQFARLQGVSDYQTWAKGLQKFGYPTDNKRLAVELIEIIERYQLHRLDKM